MKFEWNDEKLRLVFKRYSQITSNILVPYRPDLIDCSDRYPIVTIAKILDDAGNEVSKGLSRCSKKDNFDKEKGRKLALTRAIFMLPKDLRKTIWDTYLGR